MRIGRAIGCRKALSLPQLSAVSSRSRKSCSLKGNSQRCWNEGQTAVHVGNPGVNPIDRPRGPLIPIAHITRTQGRHGAVRIQIVLDDPRLFETGRTVVLGRPEQVGAQTRHNETRIEECRLQHGRWVMKLAGIDSIEAAEAWIGSQISIRPEALPVLGEGSFFGFDLEGCQVHAGNECLGTVTGILAYAGNTLLKVDRGGKELLIPFVHDCLRKVDIQAKRIDVQLPEGLLELYE